MKYFLDTFGLDSEVAFESCLRQNTVIFNALPDFTGNIEQLINVVILKVTSPTTLVCN